MGLWEEGRSALSIVSVISIVSSKTENGMKAEFCPKKKEMKKEKKKFSEVLSFFSPLLPPPLPFSLSQSNFEKSDSSFFFS